MAANAVVSEPVRISRATHVLASRQGDVTILASIKTGQFHTLDEIGNLVWDAIGNGGRVCDIVDRLAEQVPLKRESVRDRLIPFLQELYSRQLIDLDRWESPARVHPNAIPLDEVATDDVAFPVGLSVAMLCLVSVALRFLNLETVWRPAPDPSGEWRANRTPPGDAGCDVVTAAGQVPGTEPGDSVGSAATWRGRAIEARRATVSLLRPRLGRVPGPPAQRPA
jgi:hypothetical protein